VEKGPVVLVEATWSNGLLAFFLFYNLKAKIIEIFESGFNESIGLRKRNNISKQSFLNLLYIYTYYIYVHLIFETKSLPPLMYLLPQFHYRVLKALVWFAYLFYYAVVSFSLFGCVCCNCGIFTKLAG